MKSYKFKVNKNYKKLRYYLFEIGFSNKLIKLLSKNLGQINRNNKPIIMNEKVFKGDEITILNYNEEENKIIPIKNNLKIFYEDESLLVVYKDFGIATIPSYCNYENSLANYVTYYMQEKDLSFVYRAINRLDKETSGFIIICKDLIIYNLLMNKKITKKYEAIINGKTKKQTINKRILTTKNEQSRNDILRKIDNNLGKESVTKILNTKFNKKKKISYIKIKCKTGRTHQIRLHLSSIGNSIIGDELYGTKKADRMYLNCYYIKFYHPIKQKYIILKNQIFKSKFKELSQAYLEDYQSAKM